MLAPKRAAALMGAPDIPEGSSLTFSLAAKCDIII
jgi:hypothetical protein